MNDILEQCKFLINAYKKGLLDNTAMPEDTNPGFCEDESRLSYFTLPMSLNYQRNSYAMWASALKTYNEFPEVFSVKKASEMSFEKLREKLTKHKLALQPNKHTQTWKKISETISNNRATIGNMIKESENDFLKLKEFIQVKYKKGFPYLSGPKIFNYWSYILTRYCNINLKNRDFIDIAPDTHVIQSSIKLGVLTKEEAESFSREKINAKWRELLAGSGIDPIDMHSPLWFWSRQNFTITKNIDSFSKL